MSSLVTDRAVGSGFIAALSIALVLAEFALLEVGNRLGRRLEPTGTKAPTGAVTSTVLSLMGLVLAFSFSNAATRLDAARQTILAEVDAVDNLWIRIDLATPAAQSRLRDLLRGYVDARLAAYESLGDATAYRRQVHAASALLAELWKDAVAGTDPVPTPNRTLLLSAVNAVSSAQSARTLSLGTHLADPVLLFLLGIVLVGTLLSGISMSRPAGRPWFYWVIIAAVLSSIVYTILDLEFPRAAGFNLLEKADSMLRDARREML